MKKLLTLTIAGFFCFFTDAQVIEQRNNIKDLDLDLLFHNKIHENKEILFHVINIKDIKGTPYLQEDFIMGKIISNKDNSTLSVFIRYRVLDDVFEIKKEKTDSEILFMKPSNDFDILLNNRRFTLLQGLPKSKRINYVYNGFAVIMTKPVTSDKDVVLYKRISKEYHPAVAKSFYDHGKKAKLENVNFYFIGINDQLHQIIPDRREAYKAFPDKNDLLKNYIKKERLRFRNDKIDQDLTTLVNYYNSLQ